MKKIIFIFLVFFSKNSICQNNIIVPSNNLIATGIPDIPVAIKNDMQRYSESRSASFAAWHPLKKEILISTRFGNVPQLHQVKMPLGDRKQITFFDEPISDASYEPIKGNYFLFTKDIGGNEFGQIYRYDMSSGQVTLLTDGGRSQNGGIVWNEKGDQILFASTKRNGTDRDFYSMNPLMPESEKLMIQNVGGGWSIADWSSDNKKLLITQYISANESHYWIADVVSGVKVPLTDTTEKEISYGQARFSKDEKGIFFETDKGSEFKRLAYMELKTKALNYLTNIPWDVESFDISKDGTQIVFVTNEAGESKMYQMSTADKKYKLISSIPSGVCGAPSFHNNGQDVAVSVSSARSSADVYVVNLVSGKCIRWTESEMGGIVSDDLGLPKLIKWKSFDNLEVTGFYYPAAKKFSGKRPVIINIHGGPEGQSRPSFLGASNYYMNELGIVMIFPNVRGSTGYGKTFLKMDNGMKREESVQDIGALFNWIAQQPELDASKVMVTGGSYGGYMTLAVATHYNDKIRCALDVVGISNFNTFLKNTESYRRDLRRVEYGDERDSSMYAFLENISPLNNASKITKPMFIVQGGNDPRVPRTEAEQMANKIKSNGGTVWYLEAKDEGHGFRKKTNADFQRMATILFIKNYLL